MKMNIFSGATLAATAVALALERNRCFAGRREEERQRSMHRDQLL